MKDLNQTLNSIPEVVWDTVDSLGIRPHLKGYNYIAYGVSLILEDPTSIDSVTKILYPTIAKAFNTTSSRVERAIRHAIENLFLEQDYDIIGKYLNTCNLDHVRGTISNSHCLAALSNHIRREMNRETETN